MIAEDDSSGASRADAEADIRKTDNASDNCMRHIAGLRSSSDLRGSRVDCSNIRCTFAVVCRHPFPPGRLVADW